MDVVNPTDRTPSDSMSDTRNNCHCVCYEGAQSTYNIAWQPTTPECRCSCAPASENPYNADANFDLAHSAAK